MADNQYTIGRDTSVVLQHPYAPNAGRIDLLHVTGFDVEQVFVESKVKRLDGLTLHNQHPDGWRASIEIDRGNQQVDLLAQALEDAAVNNLPRQYGTLTYYIREQDGSTSTYVLTNCSVKIAQLGSFKDDAVVKQKIEIMASRRRKV